MSITSAAPALAPPAGQASSGTASITLAQVKADPEVRCWISAANENLGVIGYTDHGFRHAEIMARDARVILRRTGFSHREQDLAAVSGYLHDIWRRRWAAWPCPVSGAACAQHPDPACRHTAGHRNRDAAPLKASA